MISVGYHVRVELDLTSYRITGEFKKEINKFGKLNILAPDLGNLLKLVDCKLVKNICS